MDTHPLEDIGLTAGEIKVYLCLLELGSCKAGAVIEKTGLQSSVVHNCFHSLLEKGLISYVKKGKIKHYKATDPKLLLDFIDEKKKSFEKILPELMVKRQLIKENNEAEVYEGQRGIMNLLLETIKDAKKGDEWVFFSADVEPNNKEIQDFFSRFDPKRKEKGLVVKGIAPLRLERLFADRARKGYLTMKYSIMPLPPSLSICNNHVALFMWGEKPMGYLLHSSQLAEKYKDYFHSVWDSI